MDLEKIILQGQLQAKKGRGPLVLHKSPFWIRWLRPWRWKNRKNQWAYMTNREYQILFGS